MNLSRPIYTIGGLLLCSLVVPRPSYGITGCTNAQLTGTYNAQITSANLQTVINTLTATSTGGTGTGGTGTGGTGTGTGTTTTPNPGGFGNNTASLSGQTPGLGRYLFDGNGSIVGVGTGGTNTTIGTYTVNTDCTGTIRLNNGQTFFIVVARNGARVLFIESDASGVGATGELALSQNACITTGGTPLNFAFSFVGAQANAASTGTGTGTGGTGTGTGGTGTGGTGTGGTGTGGTGTGGTGTGGTGTGGTGTGTGGTGTGGTGTGATATGATATLNSAVGSLSLDGQGGFTMREWAASNGSIQSINASGTYTIGTDCQLRLTFLPSTNANVTTPSSFRGLLVNQNSGLIVVQPTAASGIVTGDIVNQ